MKTIYESLLIVAAGIAGAYAQPAPAAAPAPPSPYAPAHPDMRGLVTGYAPAHPIARAAAAAGWQVAPTPVPPAPPAPPAAPAPAPAPIAPGDWDVFGQMSLYEQDRINEAAQKAADKAMEMQDKILEAQEKALQTQDFINDKAMEGQMKAWAKADEGFSFAPKPFNFNFDIDVKTPLLAAQAKAMIMRPGRGNVDSMYERGRRDLDAHNWEQAVTNFTDVANRAGARADGALYWKAYAQNKLGRRDEALATIAELRKTYASSRWLDDAAALEVEVKQSAGGTVAPDSTNDDEIKLLALNGLMQSDPDRAFPYLEKLLKSAASPRLKENTLYVLAQSNSPKAQQELIQIAKGGGNPDLQLYAIRYLGAANRRQGSNNTTQVLFEIYNSSNDPAVKREVLNQLSASRDKDHLLEIARNEKNHDLQLAAIGRLGGMGSQVSGDALVSLYGSAQEKDTKHEIINILAGQRNAKALVDLGRKEKDLDMKKYVVERVVSMNTPESKQFLEEILK